MDKHISEEEESDKELSDENNDGTQESEDTLNHDSLTYRPAQPSTYRVTPSNSDDEESDKVETTSGYNLRERISVDYTLLAIPETITTADEPSSK